MFPFSPFLIDLQKTASYTINIAEFSLCLREMGDLVALRQLLCISYLPLHLTGTHNMDLVMYPVFISTSRLKRESRYGSLMFRTSDVLAT